MRFTAGEVVDILFCGSNIPKGISHQHGCWCPGLLLCQAISSYSIHYVGYTYLHDDVICAILVTRENKYTIKTYYYLMLPKQLKAFNSLVRVRGQIAPNYVILDWVWTHTYNLMVRKYIPIGAHLLKTWSEQNKEE